MNKKHPASPKPAFPFETPAPKGSLAAQVTPVFRNPGARDPVQSYLDERQYRNDKDANQIATCLAMGRLELIFQVAREEIEGSFNTRDIEQMLLAFGPGFYIPGEDTALHASLAAEYGWDSFEDVPPAMRSLYNKLYALTVVQSLALADVLERISNVYLWGSKHGGIGPAAAAAGLLLSDSTTGSGNAQ